MRSLSNSIQHSADERATIRVFLYRNTKVCDDGPKSSGVCGFVSDFVVHVYRSTHPPEAVLGFGIIGSIPYKQQKLIKIKPDFNNSIKVSEEWNRERNEQEK